MYARNTSIQKAYCVIGHKLKMTKKSITKEWYKLEYNTING